MRLTAVRYSNSHEDGVAKKRYQDSIPPTMAVVIPAKKPTKNVITDTAMTTVRVGTRSGEIGKAMRKATAAPATIAPTMMSRMTDRQPDRDRGTASTFVMNAC